MKHGENSTKYTRLETMTNDQILKEIGWRNPPTPDIVFSEPILINGAHVTWIDAKNFFLTYLDKVRWNKIQRQCLRCTEAFGPGALVCLGFMKGTRPPQKDVMFLDGSCWKM